MLAKADFHPNGFLKFVSSGKANPASLVRTSCYLLLLLASGCASYGVIQNTEITSPIVDQGYSMANWSEGEENGELAFALTFSGGGTRAAAMAYGVLEELRDTEVTFDHKQKRLLDEVDHISSVSGGSFAAAYYGLHGDHMFDIFEDEFLRLDMDKPLTESLFNPLHWFTREGRMDRTIEYYEKTLFHGATFVDMMQPGRPMILINASDLAYGVRFSFIQEYFNFLCSDLGRFSVARAVAASSAVPILFNPVVIENYSSCGDYSSVWPSNAEELGQQDAEFGQLYTGLRTFADKDRRKFVHLVDGGITDNMGLRAQSDIIALAGGIKAYMQKMHRKPPRVVIVIAVNASTNPVTEMDESNKEPSIVGMVNAMSGVQLHRYNTATLELVEKQLAKFTESMSTPEHPLKTYFIQVSFDDIREPQLKTILNKIPTSFNLTDEQVTALISNARSLLKGNPTFQQLLADLKGESGMEQPAYSGN